MKPRRPTSETISHRVALRKVCRLAAEYGLPASYLRLVGCCFLIFVITAPTLRGLSDERLRDPRETHLRSVRQLTFEGQNAEAYFSFDGKRLIFQSIRDGFSCDQIYTMDTNGKDLRLVSTGKGRTTCGYFYPDGKHILYASTHEASGACPPRPRPVVGRGYVWSVYPSYAIYYATDEGKIISRLTPWAGYNAEAVISADGSKIVFTSSKDGDLDIFTMNLDGSKLTRLTSELGYDGGPVFSHNSQWIAYRAYHPNTPEEVVHYKELLAENLVEPKRMDIYIMRADGSAKRQLTNLGRASFAPCWSPDDGHIVFSSNYKSASEREFHLYRVKRTGGTPEQITFAGTFNSFPLFSPDGHQLVFASNRNAKQPHEINIFIAEWIP